MVTRFHAQLDRLGRRVAAGSLFCLGRSLVLICVRGKKGSVIRVIEEGIDIIYWERWTCGGRFDKRGRRLRTSGMKGILGCLGGNEALEDI